MAYQRWWKRVVSVHVGHGDELDMSLCRGFRLPVFTSGLQKSCPPETGFSKLMLYFQVQPPNWPSLRGIYCPLFIRREQLGSGPKGGVVPACHTQTSPAIHQDRLVFASLHFCTFGSSIHHFLCPKNRWWQPQPSKTFGIPVTFTFFLPPRFILPGAAGGNFSIKRENI